MQRFLSSISELFPLDDKLRKVLVIAGSISYESSGAQIMLKPLLAKHNSKHYTVTQLNPELDEIDQVSKLCREFMPDVIIAIGGGSVMDVAKAARFLAYQNDNSKTAITKGVASAVSPSAHLVAVPTTAGSGAESTHFAVVYDDGSKYSLAHEYVRPDDVVLDGRLTKSVPKKVAAASGMDALAQAIESYWSVRSTEESRQLSITALRLIVANIEPSVHVSTAATRQAMLEGANLAGRAIDVAFTTAPHALSYAFTVQFGVSHGEAVGLTLPDFIRFNAALSDEDCNDERGVGFVQKRFEGLVDVFDQSDTDGMAKRIEGIRMSIGLASSVHIDQADEAVWRIVMAVNQQRLKNNPRVVTSNDMARIARKIILE